MKGFSTRFGAVSRRYYITADYKRTSIRQLREMIDESSSKINHPDLRHGRIKKDEHDVQALLEMFETTWTNPFVLEDTSTLSSISTGAVPSAEVLTDLLNAFN